MSKMIYGTHKVLEEEADRLLRESLQGVTSYEAKKDILTPWKEKDRASREIPFGALESDARRGMYHRKSNLTRQDLNARDGLSRSRNKGMGFAQVYLQEHGCLPD